MPPRYSTQSGLDAHTRNFLECIKSREPTHCTIEMGRDAALVAHLGNIAYRSGKKLEWQESSGSITNFDDAVEYLKPEYRAPWKLWKG